MQNSQTERVKILEAVKSLIALEMSDHDVQAADDLAAKAHAGETRKSTGGPYVDHPRRVKSHARELGYGKDIQIISLLHDILEHALNRKKMESLILDKFGPDILAAVILLTHDKKLNYKDYVLFMAKTKSQIAQKAFKVKMLDMYDNLTESPSQKMIDKYRGAIIALIEAGHESRIPKKILDIFKTKEKISEAPPKPPEPPEEPEKGSDKPEPGAGKPDAGADNPFSGAASSGGSEPPNPFADPEGMPGGEEGPDGGADSEDSIAKYNEKMNSMKVIKFSKKEEEPGFQFSNANPGFYTENYISSTKNGSLMLAVPKENIKDIDTLSSKFFKDYVLRAVKNAVDNSLKRKKRVVLVGSYGLPYFEGKYQHNEQGLIAKFLVTKYPKGYVLFDTWNPKDYFSFMSNSNVWKQLKERTEAKGKELKAAMYLLSLLQNNKELSEKLKSKDVDSLIGEWGIDSETLGNKIKLYKTLHPEESGEPQTLPSMIVNTYEYLLRVAMLEKVNRYEKKGLVVILPVDTATAWVLQDSFRKMDEMKPSKNEPPETEEEPEGGEGEQGEEGGAGEEGGSEKPEEPEEPEGETALDKKKKAVKDKSKATAI